MAIQYESKVAKSRTSEYGSGTEVVKMRLDTYVLQVLPQDILTVLRGVAIDELEEQVTGGNLVSQILVDGRAVQKRSILEAKRSVSLRFGDTKMLLQAMKVIYANLLTVTRIQTPPKNNIVARQHFWLYLDGKPVGLLPGALTKVRESDLTIKSVLRVVGPLVPYGRKLYWNPPGRGKVMELKATMGASGREILHYDNSHSPRFKPFRMRTLRRLANSSGGNPAENLKRLLSQRPGSVEGAGQIVKRIVRRDKRFAGLYISDGWISYPPAGSWGKNSRNDRVPSVSVQLARKGQVNLAGVL